MSEYMIPGLQFPCCVSSILVVIQCFGVFFFVFFVNILISTLMNDWLTYLISCMTLGVFKFETQLPFSKNNGAYKMASLDRAQNIFPISAHIQ